MKISNENFITTGDEDSVIQTVKSWSDGNTLKPTSSYNRQGDLYTLPFI